MGARRRSNSTHDGTQGTSQEMRVNYIAWWRLPRKRNLRPFP